MDILVKRPDPKPSPVFNTYWKFAAERQAMYFRRLRSQSVFVPDLSSLPGESQSVAVRLTADPILAAHRFTNVYRVADRVSQYLIRRVVYTGDPDPKEVAFRTLLFKIFNRIETWEMIAVGGEVRSADLPRIRRILDATKADGRTLYSAAYVMPSPGNAKVKHVAHLDLLAGMDWSRILGSKSLEVLYGNLLAVPSFGSFLAFQFAIDLNYGWTFDFDEDDFVVAGPGARSGLRKMFTDPAGRTEADLIRWIRDRSEVEFARLGLKFETLFGRWPKLIDLQNVACEYDKYCRAAHPEIVGIGGRDRIKQQYRPDPRPLDAPFFPPKWGLEIQP